MVISRMTIDKYYGDNHKLLYLLLKAPAVSACICNGYMYVSVCISICHMAKMRGDLTLWPVAWVSELSR